MIDRDDSGRSAPDRGADRGDEHAELRFGRHAVRLLLAARETGNPALIAQAEAVAMAAGYVLGARVNADDERYGG